VNKTRSLLKLRDTPLTVCQRICITEEENHDHPPCKYRPRKLSLCHKKVGTTKKVLKVKISHTSPLFYTLSASAPS